MIACSCLPLGSDTLAYGSGDGGRTVHKDDPVLNELMEEAAKRINIKGHMTGQRGREVLLHAPTDIEGHRGKDGRYYVCGMSFWFNIFCFNSFC